MIWRVIMKKCLVPAIILMSVSLVIAGQTDKLNSSLITRPVWLNMSVSDDHFEVWYTDDSTNYPDDAITQADAQRVLDFFELVRDIEVLEWGYPEPVSAGNIHYEIWIQYLVPPNNGAMFDPETGTPVNTSKIRINSKLANLSYADPSLLLSIAGHEYHHAIEETYIHMGTGPELLSRIWLLEFSSSWAGYMVRRSHPEIPGAAGWDYLRDRLNYFTGHSYNGLQSIANAGSDIRDYHDAVTFAWFLTENTIAPLSGPCSPSREIIKDFWESMSSFGDWNHVPEAFTRALAEAPTAYSDFDSVFEAFALAIYLNKQAFPIGSDGVTPDRSFNSTDFDSPDDSTMDIDLETAASPINLISSASAEPRAIGPMGVFYLELHPGSLGRQIGVTFRGEPATRFAVHLARLNNGTGCHDERIILDPSNSGYALITLNPANQETEMIAIIRLDESGTGTYEVELDELGVFQPSPGFNKCDLWVSPKVQTIRRNGRDGGCSSLSDKNDLMPSTGFMLIIMAFLIPLFKKLLKD